MWFEHKMDERGRRRFFAKTEASGKVVQERRTALACWRKEAYGTIVRNRSAGEVEKSRPLANLADARLPFVTYESAISALSGARRR